MKKGLLWGMLALALTTACTEKDVVPGGPTPEQDGVSNTTSYAVETSDQSRVNNFNFPTRSSMDFVMPECPTPPAGAPNMDNTYGTLQTGVTYVIDDYRGGWIPNGATIFIRGNVTIDWWNSGEGNATIYILPGGSLTFNSTITTGTTIYNYGNLTGNITVANDVRIYSAVDMEFGSLGMNAIEGGNTPAEIYCKGALIAREIRLNGEISACAIIADKVTLNDNGTFKTGYIKAKNLEFNAAYIILDHYGLIDVEETIYFSNEFTRITVDGEKAVMSAKYFCTNNKEWIKNQIAKEIYCKVEEAYVGSAYYRGETIDLYSLGLQNSDINSDFAWVPASGCHDEFGDVPEGETPTDPLPGWQLIKTGEIEEAPAPGHDHNSDKNSKRKLSATCIDGDGSNFYVSYHMRGLNYAGQDWDAAKDPTEGCIEYFTVDENGDITLQSFMWTQEMDFNHILLDNDKMLTVGHCEKKGSILGSLPLTFTSTIGTSDDFNYVQLTTDEPILVDGKSGKIVDGFVNAGDGNCVIKIGNEYFVTTSRGYLKVAYDTEKQAWTQPRDYTDREKGVPMFGRHNDASVKHIINDGNGGVIMLALDTPTPGSYDYYTESTASLIRYNSDNLDIFPSGTPAVTAIASPAISPIDGKNVIAIDPSNPDCLYACMGNGGLAVIKNGTVTKIWKHIRTAAEEKIEADIESKLPVNGVAVDDDFIYVANGNLVSVLDKNDFEEIATYHASSYISANYILLKGDYIYVAYGQDGILQLQLQKNS